jgi:glycosyltransferase involved in cell wall biosynthesis
MPANPAPCVLFLSGVQGDTRRYRTFHPYQQLRLAGVDCILSHLTSPGLPESAARAEVAIVQRAAMDSFVESLFRSLRRHGALILYDTDDLLFDPDVFRWIDSPDFSDPVRKRLYQEEMRRQRLTLEASDAALVSTDYLAERVSRLNKSAWVHRNAFSLEMVSLADKAGERKLGLPGRLIIGYASGTPTHDRDFELLSPALQRFLETHKEAELRLVGPLNLSESWARYAGQVQRYPFVSWRRLPALLAEFDINLAPLTLDNPFSLSKSEIKYLEAALVCVPTIASPTDAFKLAIDHGENGYLAESGDEWYSALEQLATSPHLRRQVGQSARAKAYEQYSPRIRSQELAAILTDVSLKIQGKALWGPEALLRMEAQLDKNLSQPEAFWVPEKLERQPTLAKRAVYQLLHRNLFSLAGYVWIYLRRRLAFIFPFRQ